MCGQFPLGEYSLALLSILSLWLISSQRTVFCSLCWGFFSSFIVPSMILLRPRLLWAWAPRTLLGLESGGRSFFWSVFFSCEGLETDVEEEEVAQSWEEIHAECRSGHCRHLLTIVSIRRSRSRFPDPCQARATRSDTAPPNTRSSCSMTKEAAAKSRRRQRSLIMWLQHWHGKSSLDKSWQSSSLQLLFIIALRWRFNGCKKPANHSAMTRRVYKWWSQVWLSSSSSPS